MKKFLWTAAEAAAATGGKAKQDWQASGVSIDSRTVEKGDLFIALKGENFDGNDFAIKALENGAAAVMVSKKLADDLPQLLVPDVNQALWDLGLAARKRSQAKIIGVTGSVGKTGTKEMLKLALSAFGKTYATIGNLNNHFGAPLSLSRMEKDAEFGVFEMGMNHAGEIAELTKLIRPDVAIITTVEAVHLEFFDGVEEIADAKAEIFLGVSDGGFGILNIDNENFVRIKKQVGKAINIKTFGCNSDADFRLVSYDNTAEGIAITATANGKEFKYNLQASGKHSAMNSLAVLAAISSLGLDFHQGLPALAKYSPTKGRGQIFSVKIAGGEALLIDDSYNASPASCRAGFEVLAKNRKNGRAIALLGDMRELGAKSASLHAALADDIVASNIDLVFTAGELMENLHKALPESRRGKHYPDSAAMAKAIRQELKSGDAIMVKGSNGSKMMIVSEEIKNAL